MRSISSLASAPARWKNAPLTRLSSAPARSKATIVLSKVGAAGLRDDRGDLGPPLGQRRVEGRREVLRLDAIERRRAERRVPRFKQGIVDGGRELIHAGELGASRRISQPPAQPPRPPVNDQCVWTIFHAPARRA